ncbi:MAG: Lrp/AsnC family transcriptional regulator [Lentisphaeria bacterium]|nr:Lrp/AsnC family transcriptional regulator [Lentisphaeria bacterium]
MRHAIVKLLQSNARMSAREIADRLSMQEAEVTSLVTAMERDGTILGYCAMVNTDAMDDDETRAIIEVEVQPERDGGFDRVARTIGRFREVQAVYLVSGRYDLRLEITGQSLREIAFFVASKLAPIDGVKSTATHFLLKKYKEAGFMLDKEEEYARLKVSP